MTADRLAENLTDRYLAELASDREVMALATRIRSDAVFADEFAHACRMDGFLSEYFSRARTASNVTAMLPTLRGVTVAVQPAGRLRLPARPTARTRWIRRLGLAAAAVAVVAAAAATIALWPWRGPGGAVIAGEVLSGALATDGGPVRRIPVGKAVRPTGDAPAVVRMNDGSETRLEPGATAVFRGQTDGARQQVDLRCGTAHFQVARSNGTFEVTTSLGRVRALGTAFSVSLLGTVPYGQGLAHAGGVPAALSVAVASGAVEVSFAGGTYRLAAGDESLFTADSLGTRKLNVIAGRLDKVERTGVVLRRPSEKDGQGRVLALDAMTVILMESGADSVSDHKASGGGRVEPREAGVADLKVGQEVLAQYTDDGAVVKIVIRRLEGQTLSPEAGPSWREPVSRMDRLVGFSKEQKRRIDELDQNREATIRKIETGFQADMMDLLTPEQRAKWQAASKEDGPR